MIAQIAGEVPALSYDEETNRFTIDFSDPREVMDGYTRSPVIRAFIDFEILVRRKHVHEQDHRNVSRYEVLGYAYDEMGEDYTFTQDWIQDAQEWMKETFDNE